MPNALSYPRGAIACQVDVRRWQGERLFSFGTTHTDAPSTWGPFFDDVLALLTGRGTVLADDRCNMARSVDTALTAATAITVGVTSTDRIFILAAGLAGAFTMAAGAGNAALGFDVAGQTSATLFGGEYMVATGEWQRGAITSVSPTITSSVADGGTSGPLVAPKQYRVHSALDLLRTLGSADLDDSAATTSLASLSATVRWGVDADGHVFMARNLSEQGNTITWVEASFRDFLGFTGAETETTPAGSSNLRVLTATHPCSGLLTPSRPLERVTDLIEHIGQAQLLTSGRQYWTGQQILRRFEVVAYVDGYCARIDRARHFVDRVAPYLHPGAWVNIYQDWGDPRRSLRSWDVVPAAGRSAYSTLYTSQRDGDYGRLRCYVDRGGPKTFSLVYDGQVRQRAPITLQLTERPTSDA